MSYDWKCFMNEHVTMLMPKERWGNFDSKLAEFTDDIINNEVKITYPIGWRGTEPIYFGALIGAPHIIDKVNIPLQICVQNMTIRSSRTSLWV
ncbi:hypothetical protein WUBG_18258 [Wuchereria bancrofti]|uniref:Uncharacterized protein n=1 Tax=Wuchereria bancrofti TaxID=6293 RepID=J9E652_WUCBA|nr:hypothetical protein WUBG_18258 [Wuchereria bancrofti]